MNRRQPAALVIDLKNRVVEIAGIVHRPHGEWMMQVGGNLLDAFDGIPLGKTHLFLDRDPVFTDQYRRLLKDAGVEVVRVTLQGGGEHPAGKVSHVKLR